MSYLFIDEIEFNSKVTGPVIYYIGVGVASTDCDKIEEELKTLLDKLPNKKFHAKDIYKDKSPDIVLMNDLTRLAITYNLPLFLFRFAKSFLQHPRLEVLKEIIFKYENLPLNQRVPSLKNFKFAALFLFNHCVNWYLPLNSQLPPKYHLIFDKGIIKAGIGFDYNDSPILNTIKDVMFFNQKQKPILALADHFSFLFGKCKRELENKENTVSIFQTPNASFIAKESYRHLRYYEDIRLFHVINIFKWIDAENNRLGILSP